MAKNDNVGAKIENSTYTGEQASKNEHEDKVSSSTPERALLEHTAITVCEDDVEKKVESKRTEK